MRTPEACARMGLSRNLEQKLKRLPDDVALGHRVGQNEFAERKQIHILHCVCYPTSVRRLFVSRRIRDIAGNDLTTIPAGTFDNLALLRFL